MTYIEISTDQFYTHFSGQDRYVLARWTGIPADLPEPPYWEAHLDWVFDKTKNQYVGYTSSSSWSNIVHYTILEELATPEMIKWNENYLIEEKKKKEEFDKRTDNVFAKHPTKRFDPSKSGLMELSKNDNVISYSPETPGVDEIIKMIEDVWYKTPLK